jgi:hypothetical protein
MTGEDPPSSVEVVEKEGEPRVSTELASCASVAGWLQEAEEGKFSIFAAAESIRQYKRKPSNTAGEM